MPEVNVSDREWPLVQITYPSSIDDEDMRRFIARIDGLSARAQPFAMVVDATASNLTATQRKLMSDAAARWEKQAPGRIRGCGIVMPASSLARGVMTALMWIFKPPYPMKVFETRPEAVVWVRGLLKA